jgi:sugar fermentation stimulation protein A
MFFQPPLQTGTLLKRYKRFLADIKFDDGTQITAHCPNTGSMSSCSTPGSRAAVSLSDNPKRKYPHTLEMVQDNGTWVGVNTSRTNNLVVEAIREQKIEEFANATTLRQEVKVSPKSRLDILVDHDDTSTFIEVKNCSLATDGCAMFPDAVTARGTKHLEELISLVENGTNACIFFLIQRMDADRFRPAREIDPVYSTTLKKAVANGVLAIASQAEVTPDGISVVRRLPIELF